MSSLEGLDALGGLTHSAEAGNSVRQRTECQNPLAQNLPHSLTETARADGV
jgi:hypothetical protein